MIPVSGTEPAFPGSAPQPEAGPGPVLRQERALNTTKYLPYSTECEGQHYAYSTELTRSDES